jgi:hypothetical protein
MTIENKYLDEMLERLDGYKPSVEPDWDAFYQKNKENISIKNNTGIVSKTVVRLTLLVITIAVVVTGGYFYLQSNSTAESMSPEEKTEFQATENTINNDLQEDNPAAAAPGQLLQIIPQNPAPLENNNDAGIKTIIGDNDALPEKTTISGSIPEVGQTIINEPNAKTAIVPKDSATSGPVIIKKTVIIKDTIHVRPIKKDK